MRVAPSLAIVLTLVLAGCGSDPKKFGDADADEPTPDIVEITPEPDPDPDMPDDLVDAPPSDCGNGTLEGWEECDDGNTDPGDGCSPDCRIEMPPHCGDCDVDYDELEQCDDCNNDPGDGCGPTCQRERPPTCGDGVLDIDMGEQCDDGNTDAGDTCSPTCQFETVGATCGDSTRDPGERCDDGNLVNGDACNPTCNLTNTCEDFVGSQGNQGNVDGVASAARIGGYGNLAVDDTYLYYADSSNYVIRRIELATATIETIAGTGTAGYLDDPDGASAQFMGTGAIATDGNTLWVAGYRRIRAVDLTSPFGVTTVAGSGAQGDDDGFGLSAEFDDLRGLTYYNGLVYLVDGSAATLRSFDPVSTEVATLAGQPYITGQTDGIGSAARFISPRYVASDNSGMLYVADTNGNTIRAFNTMTNEVTTFAGDGTVGYADGTGTSAIIHRPRGMTSDGTSVYWVEFNQHTIRQGIFSNQRVSTLAGTHCGGTDPCAGGYASGVGTAALFDQPFAIAFDYPSNSLYIVDSGNYVIRRCH